MSGPFSHGGGGSGLSEADVRAIIDDILAGSNSGYDLLTSTEIDALVDAAINNAIVGTIQDNINDSIANAVSGEIQDNIDAAVAAAVASIIGTATALGDTLGELEASIALKVAKAGDTMTGQLTMEGTGIVARNDTGNIGFENTVYVTSSVGANYRVQKARGTTASPSTVAQNDNIGSFNARGYGASAFQNAGQFNFSVITATPSNTDMQGRWGLFLSPAASVTLTEILRADHTSGFMMFGGNVVINQNRHFELRSYTLGTRPSASPARQMISVSDLGGGAGLMISDGTVWRRQNTEGYAAVATDADFTFTNLASAPNIRHTGTLTADRTVTLSTTDAYAGARARFTRTGGGAFNLSIGGLKNLATNTWCEITYNGSAWYLSAYGAL